MNGLLNIEIAPGRLVGPDHPCFVIAEIGSNHNQDLDLAKRHIDAAAEAGVDAVKFQTFRAREHFSRKTPGLSYLDGEAMFELIESLELDRSWHEPLMAHAQAAGVEFLSSACDHDAVRELDDLGMSAFKVASFDLPDIFLLRRMAETGKPLILSTGMASLADIQQSVEVCRSAGNERLVLLQCTSLYPAPVELSNLNAMRAMGAAFGLPVGYSDHTLGDHIALAAVAMGACMLEKHFTLDRNLPGPDHSFAIEPAELRQMMERLREVEAAKGDGQKTGPRPEEQEMFDKGRRSLHAAAAIPEGTTITSEMLTVKRPGLGISPYLADQIVGRKARRAIEADEWITWDAI